MLYHQKRPHLKVQKRKFKRGKNRVISQNKKISTGKSEESFSNSVNVNLILARNLTYLGNAFNSTSELM